MKTPRPIAPTNTSQKRPVGQRTHTAARPKRSIPRGLFVNFAVLLLFFIALALILQFSQKSNRTEEEPAEVSVEAPPEPTMDESKTTAAMTAAKKFAAAENAETAKLDRNRAEDADFFSRNSLLQKKRTVAWGDFIPFEKKR